MSTPSMARLMAETIAWPLWSIEATRVRLVAFARGEQGDLDQVTAGLVGAFEEHMRHRGGGLPLETLHLLHEHEWIAQTEHRRSLVDHVTEVACELIEPSGPVFRIRLDGQTVHESELPGRAGVADRIMAHRVHRWRWLSLTLPPDLLVAATAAHADVTPLGDTPTLMTPALAEMLGPRSGGVANGHLHLGAALDFPTLWGAMMGSIGDDQGDDSERAGAMWLAKLDVATSQGLLECALLRVGLALFLLDVHEPGKGSFVAWWEGLVNGLVEQRGASSPSARTLLRVSDVLARSCRGEATRETLPSLQALLRRWVRVTHRRAPRDLTELLGRDPLADFVPPGGTCAPETSLLTAGFRYLRGDGRDDEGFALAFWQYVRARNRIYRHVVTEPGTAGLTWFRRFISRLSQVRSSADTFLVEAALNLQSAGASLEAIELRLMPPKNWHQFRDYARMASRQVMAWRQRGGGRVASASGQPVDGGEAPEIGLVFHFLKGDADRERGGGGGLYARWASKQLVAASALAVALERHPELLLIIRGLDLASDELAMPCWPILPAMMRAREASRRASAVLGVMHPTWGVRPLQVTLHVGEVYRHLAEGLRRIHEPVEAGLLTNGDRLGHALALGVIPARWAQATRATLMPTGERLDDLLWELDLCENGDVEPSAGRTDWLRARTRALGQRIFGGEVPIGQLQEMRQLRLSAAHLQSIHYATQRTLKVEGLLGRYLTDDKVQRRCREPIEVHCGEADVRALNGLQLHVQRVLASMDVTIETNPTSNRIVGDFSEIDEHPIFQLCPLVPNGKPCLGVSIHDDDPLSFTTRLVDEYAYLYFEMILHGVSSSEALRWLSQARDTSMRSRFTLPATRRADSMTLLQTPRHEAR